jgi:hypothetical protein
MDSFINVALLKHPLNYLIVFFMVALPLTAMTFFHERLGK